MSLHQEIMDEWAGVLALIETVRPNAEHPDAISFLDAVQKHAEEQTALMAHKKAEAEAKALAPE